jgi:hypothetical protein
MNISRGATGPVVGLWLLVILATGGCSTSQSDSRDGSLGQKALQNLTSLEQKILADKAVTPGEYQLAVQDTVSCLRTAGFTVTDPVNDADGSLTYMASYSPPEMANAGPDAPPPDSSKMDAKNAACEQRSAGAAAVFMLQHAASEEESKRSLSVFVTCAEQHGVKISVAKNSREAGKVIDEVQVAEDKGLITKDQADKCKDSFRASSFRPLPGLSEALAHYKP